MRGWSLRDAIFTLETSSGMERQSIAIRSAIEPVPGVGIPQMLSDSDFFMMFAEQLSANHIPILGDDSDQPVHILRMLSNQLGQFLQLPLQPLHTPRHIAWGFRRRDGRLHRRLGTISKGSHNDIALHAHSFAQYSV
jgi:hypothetical protein